MMNIDKAIEDLNYIIKINSKKEKVKETLKKCGISHTTIEIEESKQECSEPECTVESEEQNSHHHHHH